MRYIRRYRLNTLKQYNNIYFNNIDVRIFQSFFSSKSKVLLLIAFQKRYIFKRGRERLLTWNICRFNVSWLQIVPMLTCPLRYPTPAFVCVSVCPFFSFLNCMLVFTVLSAHEKQNRVRCRQHKNKELLSPLLGRCFSLSLSLFFSSYHWKTFPIASDEIKSGFILLELD